MKAKHLWELFKGTYLEWNADNVPRLGAALAYYTVFSMAPLLIIVIGIAGVVFGERAAEGGIVNDLESMVGQPFAQATQEILMSARQNGNVATILGFAILLFAASGVFLELQGALNTIWKVASKPGRGLLKGIRERILSVLAVFGTGFFVLLSLGLSASLTALKRQLPTVDLPWTGWTGDLGVSAVSLVMTSLLFAVIYKILPDAKIAWLDVWIGAIVASALFTAGKFVLGLYLGSSGITSAFGAASSLVVILLWVYYSAQILLFGAELTRVNARLRASIIVPNHQ
jgi:membrane protein